METELEKKDTEIRKEFSRIFGWYDEKMSTERLYNPKIEKVLRDPTWAEIYAQVGRLLQIKDDAVKIEGSPMLFKQTGEI